MIRFPPRHSSFGAYGVHTTVGGEVYEYWDGPGELGPVARAWLADWFRRELAAVPSGLEDTISFVFVVLSREPNMGDDFEIGAKGPILTYGAGGYPSTASELPEVVIPAMYGMAVKLLGGEVPAELDISFDSNDRGKRP